MLFVDEPTTGLDPQGRREVWSAIRELVSGGTTVLLTTQYLEEADQLADRITDARGRAGGRPQGTPDELKAAIGGDWLDVSLADPADLAAAGRDWPRRSPPATCEIDEAAAQISIPVADRTRALVGCPPRWPSAAIDPLDLTVRRPTLDEVFLHLTGTRRPTANDRRWHGDDHDAPTATELDRMPRGTGSDARRRLDDHPPAVLALARPAGRASLVGLLFPVLVTLMFGALFGGAIAGTDRGDYYSFLMPGIFAMAMLFGLESTMTAVNADAAQRRHRPLPLAADQPGRGRARPVHRRHDQQRGWAWSC